MSINWAEVRFWLCVGGSILFVCFLAYTLLTEPVWTIMMGIGIMGVGCIANTFHDVRKPEMDKFDPPYFV